MKRGRIALIGSAALTLTISLIVMAAQGDTDKRVDEPPAPVMSVTVIRAEPSRLPIRVPATGHVAAWQEASIGAEASGFRLLEVKVNVGDVVQRGQELALFDAGIVTADLAESTAAVAQAEAAALEAEANQARAKDLDGSGAMSAQEVGQYQAAAKAARAGLEAARAALTRNRLRLTQTRVVAPSDGIITSRTATVGAVVPSGQELFRMIKDSRLEWRAEVSAADLERLRAGQTATIDVPGHAPVQGRLRMVAPTIDTQTLNGLAYVDLPRHDGIRAGAFARGHFEISEVDALTVPQSAVLLRDGFHYVMGVGARSEVIVRKVSVGQRAGTRIEITQGLGAADAVIASGLSFLSDGDIVRVVDEAATQDPQPPLASTADSGSGA